MNNFIVLDGNINAASLLKLREKLINLTEDAEIVIHSTGGDLECAFSMLDLIEKCPFKITTSILGKCHSAAIVPFLAGEKRSIHKNSTMLIHEPYTTFSEDELYRINDLAYHIEKLTLNTNKLLALFEEKTNLTRKQLQKFFKNGETLLTAEDCIKFGIATEII